MKASWRAGPSGTCQGNKLVSIERTQVPLKQDRLVQLVLLDGHVVSYHMNSSWFSDALNQDTHSMSLNVHGPQIDTFVLTYIEALGYPFQQNILVMQKNVKKQHGISVSPCLQIWLCGLCAHIGLLNDTLAGCGEHFYVSVCRCVHLLAPPPFFFLFFFLLFLVSHFLVSLFHFFTFFPFSLAFFFFFFLFG